MTTINLDGSETILYGPGFQTTVLTPGMGTLQRSIAAITNPATGDVLVYDGSVFVNSSFADTPISVQKLGIGVSPTYVFHVATTYESPSDRSQSIAGYSAVYNLNGATPNNTHNIWGDDARMGFTVARRITDAGGTESPTVAMTVHLESAHANPDGVGLMVTSIADVNNATAFGANLVVLTKGGTTGGKLVGLEIDIQPNSGTSPSTDSIGLALNVFNVDMTNTPALFTNGNSGGRWGFGLLLNGITQNGVGVTIQSGAPEMEWGIHLNNGTFGTAAAQFGSQNDKPALILNRAVTSGTTNILEIKNSGGTHNYVRVNKSTVRVMAESTDNAELQLFDGTDGGWTIFSQDGVLRFATLTTGGNFSSERMAIGAAGELRIQDGMTAPSATIGWAKLYVDTADGDLKVIFGDGTVKTIVVDT